MSTSTPNCVNAFIWEGWHMDHKSVTLGLCNQPGVRQTAHWASQASVPQCLRGATFKS